MAGPKNTASKATTKDEPGGKEAVKAQEKAAAPENKVSQETGDGTPQDAKAVANQDKAEAQHPAEAPADENSGPKAVDKDAPKPKPVDTENEPESTQDRFQQEAAPVAPPAPAGASATTATDSDTVPLDPPMEESSKGSDAPVALAQAAIGDGSLNDIAVGVGLRSVNGERTGGLVDEDGNEIANFEDVLDMGDGTRTSVTVTKRVYESFYLPGSQRPLTRLLYADGAIITRETARAVSEAAKA